MTDLNQTARAAAPDRIWIWFADVADVEAAAIRKWSSEPFAEGTEYRRAAAPLPEEVGRLVAEWAAAMEGVTPGPWTADQSNSRKYLDAVQFSYQSGSKGTVALVGKDEAQVGASETEEQNANSGWIARCSPDGIRSLLALLTQQAQALADANARLPRLTDDMMRAAARAHFASDNIDGIGMTANGIDYSFRQAFTRMWSGIRRARGGNND